MAAMIAVGVEAEYVSDYRGFQIWYYRTTDRRWATVVTGGAHHAADPDLGAVGRTPEAAGRKSEAAIRRRASGAADDSLLN